MSATCLKHLWSIGIHISYHWKSLTPHPKIMAEETWIRWTTTSKQVLPRWLFPQLQCETHPLYLHLFADTRPKGYGAAASLSSGKQSSTATNAITMTNWEKQPSIHILINVSRLITLSCLLVYEDKEFSLSSEKTRCTTQLHPELPRANLYSWDC